ncbi:MAG: hypothetical protein ACJ8C4_13040 [Gemmataceae bacterium]
MARILLSLTCFLALVAAYFWWAESAPATPRFAIEPTMFVPDPPLKAGSETTATLRALNRSAHPIRVLSIGFC